MPQILIAKRYAKALFELALEMNVLEEVKSDMELIHSVCISNKDFRQFLKSPVIRPEKKLKVLNTLFNDRICELSMRYFSLLTRKRREMLMLEITEEFVSIYKKFKNIFTVKFQSAREITDEIRKEVIALLEKQTKGSIDLVETVKEDLVGGFVMSYDDYRYDVSITYQLRKLRKAAAEVNLYNKKI
jgi:F-type H+-transporting ATPase subunit delta